MNVALFLEIKNEYTEHLVDTLTPYVYEGLCSIYREAAKIAEESDKDNKTLMIFQKLLQTVDTWNQIKIDDETKRIKQCSNTSDYLDDLVKAVIKSNIILLAYSNSISNIIAQTFYNSFSTSTFIHRCYTECAKDAHNNPFLFYHKVDPMDMKRNHIVIQQNIQSGITRAVRKILPISMILKEYLVNSINIIQEPTKVELIGMPLPAPAEIVDSLPKLPVQLDQAQMKALSEKKVDPKLEKEVMKLIKSESIKSDKQKIEAIMNIDKFITSMQPNRAAELSAKNVSSKKVLSSITKNKVSEALIAPMLVENSDDDVPVKVEETERKIMEINFDDQQTNEGSTHKKSVSGTSLSGSKNIQRMYAEQTSERIDPSKVNLIEDYGQAGGSRKRNK